MKPVKSVIISVLILALLTGMALRLYYLQNHVSPADTAEKENIPGAEDERLFNESLKAKLIKPFLEDERLFIEPSDFILKIKAKQHGSADFSSHEIKNQTRLINALYHSPAGRVVRNQVRLWNQSRQLSAIRDNRNQQAGASASSASQWQAYEIENSQWRFPNTGDRVSEDFGYVNNGKLQPGFSDWLTAHSIFKPVEYRTEITLNKPFLLTVQVIGVPESIHPLPQAVIPCCKPSVKNCGKEQADACELRFSLAKGKHDLIITVRPAQSKETGVAGLSIRKIYKTPGFDPEYKWVNSKPVMLSSSLTPVRIFTSDQVKLADRQGIPTDQCEKLGLTSLMGMADRTPYSLSGIAARSRFPSDMDSITLTLDSKIQTAAQESLNRKIDELFSGDKYAHQRRGAAVIMDIETGAVLAAAGWPAPPNPAEIHPWDIASFSKIYSAKNPMLVKAWQGTDRHSAPGSTFKPVTALAAMDAAKENNGLAKFIKGFSIKSEFEKNTGLSLNCASYDPVTRKCVAPDDKNFPYAIDNFADSPLSSAFEKNKQTFGLRQAVRDSVNVWFVRLGLLIDGKAAQDYDNAFSAVLPEFPDFQLNRTAQKLGFGNELIDLAPDTPSDIHLFRRKFGEGDVLFARPGKPELMKPQKNSLLVNVLAKNSIGQSVTATPLQMARVAAAIAENKLVSPFLIHKWGTHNAALPKPEQFNMDENLLNILQDGMKAVTESGTARHAFKKFRNGKGVFGKTGTANVGEYEGGREKKQRNFYTAWFTGWYETENPKAGKIAFACMVTHANGKDKNTGGKVCAPVIAEILTRLYEKNEVKN